MFAPLVCYFTIMSASPLASELTFVLDILSTGQTYLCIQLLAMEALCAGLQLALLYA